MATGEIERRFQQSDLATMKEIESMLISAANGRNEPITENVLHYQESDVNKDRLKIQLMMIPDMIKTALSAEVQVKEVTNIRTIANAMKSSNICRGMLSEIEKVLKIYFTFPVTSATSERSFSSLQRIKTYLRNSMTHSWLNNLFLLHVHQTKTDQLDLVTIAKEFVNVNSRRLRYFGKFNSVYSVYHMYCRIINYIWSIPINIYLPTPLIVV